MRIHQEDILLKATPDLVREFIVTPERILDYYPAGIDCGVFEAGKSFYCRGKSGVSLLELDTEQSTKSKLVLKVTTALNLKPPFTPQKIRNHVFFTMVEDWEIQACDQGTRLRKSWRDIKKHKLKLLPIGLVVKLTAKSESSKLKLAWDSLSQA